MAGRISKVKVTAEGWINVTSQEKYGEQNEKEITFKSPEAPHEEFTSALNGLEPHVRTILGWDYAYARGRIRIMGATFSFSEKTEVEGAVISGLVMLETCDGPFTFNTPHLPYDQYSETGAGKLMPMEAQQALAELKDQAAAFVAGKRAQANLFERAA
jgi:hypothetical protein